jgi:hypothetical protein
VTQGLAGALAAAPATVTQLSGALQPLADAVDACTNTLAASLAGSPPIGLSTTCVRLMPLNPRVLRTNMPHTLVSGATGGPMHCTARLLQLILQAPHAAGQG